MSHQVDHHTPSDISDALTSVVIHRACYREISLEVLVHSIHKVPSCYLVLPLIPTLLPMLPMLLLLSQHRIVAPLARIAFTSGAWMSASLETLAHAQVAASDAAQLPSKLLQVSAALVESLYVLVKLRRRFADFVA